MDSELLMKFIGCFPDYLSALSRTLLRFVWKTFVETAVYIFFYFLPLKQPKAMIRHSKA